MTPIAIDRTKYLSDAELEQLRAHTKAHGSPIRWLLVDLATQTGLRVSELQRIIPRDLDLARGLLRVVRAKKRGKQKPDLLPLSPEILAHLSSHIAAHKLNPKDSIWPGAKGPWTIRGLQQAWKAACKAAGLSPEISIHAARHTLAVKLLRQSKNLRMVQKHLGHSSPVTTANMYADVSFEETQNALKAIFGEPTAPAPSSPEIPRA